MLLRNVCLIGLLGIISVFANAQTDAYRNKNWHPEKGKFYFSEVMTWKFLNEVLPQGNENRQGEFAIYIDPPTGTMLFTPEAYGSSSEMTDFIIVFQNGRYIQGFSDEFGKQKYMVDTLNKFEDVSNEQKWVKQDFKNLVKPTGKSKTFGANANQWPVIKAKSYELSYLKTTEKSNLYLSEKPQSLLPMYLFNELDTEARLPVNFNYSQVIPLNYWVLEDQTYLMNQEREKKLEVRTTLISISPTEYFIDLNERLQVKKLKPE